MSDSEVGDLSALPSHSSTEELCTPPGTKLSLEQTLIDTPGAELEALLEKVLEKRPELRDRISSSQSTVKKAKSTASEEKIEITWCADLTGKF